MIDYRLATRVNPGIAVGSPGVTQTARAAGMAIQGRFSGPLFSDVRGRSVSTSIDGGVCSASLSAFLPLDKIAIDKIAVDAGLSAGGNAINLSINRNETSADRALSGARAWSPPD